MSSNMKIVLDTNVWISGLLWKGSPARLLRLAESNQFEICSSDAIFTEFERVLGYARIQRQLQKLRLSQSEVVEFALKLIKVFITDPKILKNEVAADPDDDMFLACALSVGAQYLVSGDRHLLDMEEWRGIQIVTVKDFLAQHFPEANPIE
jgi:putative PIN family toxin of toxin-antitoxin system